MKNIILTFALVLFTINSFCQRPLQIGNKWPKASNKSFYFIPSGLHPSTIEKQGDIDFQIVTENQIVRFISTNDVNFKISDKNYIGLKLADFHNKPTVKLYQGWGYYLPIDKEWYAYFGDKTLSDSSEVLSVFKYKF